MKSIPFLFLPLPALTACTSVPTANIWSLRARDGLSVIADLGSALGARFDVLAEPSLNSHSIVLLTEASKARPGDTPSHCAWRRAA